MKQFTLGSLFAGIGGIDLGFERAGFKTAWQVEIDPYCQKVLAKNFPHAERYADIRECGAHNLSPVDVVAGGFPCQDISNAGKRAGIDGERSGLWSEYARIIRELRPRFVFVENVSALLGRGMGRVLGDLAALGYDAEWECVSAADVGAPHLRERIWIVAYANGGRAYTEPLSVAERIHSLHACGHGPVRQVANAKSERCGEAREFRRDESTERIASGSEALAYCHGDDAQRVVTGSTHAEERSQQRERPSGSRDAGYGGQWSVEPNVGRVAYGIPSRVDRLRGLGNAVVPQIPEMFAHQIRKALERIAA